MVYTNIGKDEKGIYVFLSGRKVYAEKPHDAFQFIDFYGNPKGNIIGIDLDFKFPKLNGILYYGFINYGDAKMPQTVFFRSETKIIGGKATIDINKLSQYKRFGGTRNETSIRRAFANLLEEYCLTKNLVLIDELQLKNSAKRPDGTIKGALQLDWGFWESKDTKDNLDEEIDKKLAIGYPVFNIIFENSEQIILIQQGEEKISLIPVLTTL